MSNPVKAINRAIDPVVRQAERIVAPAVKAAERAFTMPDNGQSATAAAITDQTAALREANDIATQAAKDANSRVAAVSISSADSESARRAAEARMRRLRESSGFTAGAQAFGAGPVGYRLLSGS